MKNHSPHAAHLWCYQVDIEVATIIVNPVSGKRQPFMTHDEVGHPADVVQSAARCLAAFIDGASTADLKAIMGQTVQVDVLRGGVTAK